MDPHSGQAEFEIAKRNLGLLESGDYHDFIIKCGNREFKVHRNIICPQSVMLATLCTPNWKVKSPEASARDRR
jgi:hypothetical protein